MITTTNIRLSFHQIGELLEMLSVMPSAKRPGGRHGQAALAKGHLV